MRIEGNISTVNGIYTQYRNSVFSQAIRVTKCEHRANDIVQDVFLRCLVSRVDFNAIKNIPAYLFTMTRNRLLNERNHSRRESISKNEYLLQYRKLWPPMEYPVQEKEYHSLMEIAIRRLPLRQRQVFHMKREHSMKNKEIAQCLRISECTVKIHYTKAMKSLKQFAGDHIK